MYFTKAVISLACRRIHKYADKQVGTIFLRWCLMCICGFLRVFIGAQTADVRRCGFWAMPTSHLFKVTLADDGTTLTSKRVLMLSRRYCRLKTKSLMTNPTPDTWECPNCTHVQQDYLRCIMCNVPRTGAILPSGSSTKGRCVINKNHPAAIAVARVKFGPYIPITLPLKLVMHWNARVG